MRSSDALSTNKPGMNIPPQSALSVVAGARDALEPLSHSVGRDSVVGWGLASAISP